MSDSLGKPWSDNPNAPKVPYWVYFGEKSYFAGVIIGAILYGVVIVLFFKCMGVLFDPANRRMGGSKWGFVVHSVAMFSFATIYIAMSINIQSISFIDNREFPGISDAIPPGPVGYQFFIHSKAIGIAPTPMILINSWLADGLLLYRCYVVYAMSHWVILFPCLMFLASLGLGIMFIYQTTRPENLSISLANGTPYLTVTFSLNMILTAMIVVRLIVHRRNARRAISIADSAGGLYTTIITIIIESYGISAISSLLYIGAWAANSFIQYVFLQILVQAEVIAPFLIIIRVAGQRPNTNQAVVRGGTSSDLGSIHFESPGKHMDGPTNSTDPRELGIGVETTVELYRDRVSEGSLKV